MTGRQPVNLESASVARGKVYVLPERCKGCLFCIEFCPTDVLVESEDFNAKGYHYPVLASETENRCVHCQFCNLICPELAIFTEEIT